MWTFSLQSVAHSLSACSCNNKAINWIHSQSNWALSLPENMYISVKTTNLGWLAMIGREVTWVFFSLRFFFYWWIQFLHMLITCGEQYLQVVCRAHASQNCSVKSFLKAESTQLLSDHQTVFSKTKTPQRDWYNQHPHPHNCLEATSL